MTTTPNQPEYAEQDPSRLCPADAQLLDELLDASGQSTDSAIAAPASPDQSASSSVRRSRLRRLLDLLSKWHAADPELGLAHQTMAGVLCADPVELSQADGEALDALLALRREGLATGPMPAGSRERSDRVQQVLGLLDRQTESSVPTGLAQRTMQAIDRDVAKQRRVASIAADRGRGISPFSIRQIVTTAAVLLMALSVLLPILDKGQRDAMVAQCSANLAGLGIDLQRYVNDNQAASHSQAAIRAQVEQASMPATRVKLIYLMDQSYIDPAHIICPTQTETVAANQGGAYYNGQNQIVGGPLANTQIPRPIFADTNPLYHYTSTGNGLVRNANVPSLTRSANHDGRGQNVLFNDNSVRWTIQPAVNRGGDAPDNIWLLQPVKGKQGKGKQAKPDEDPDVFLTP